MLSLGRPRIILFLGFILIGGCVSNPEQKLDKNPISAATIEAVPVENITTFEPILKCVGAQISAYGTKRFYVGADEIRNESGADKGVPGSARSMLQSAFASLVEHSNGRVMWSGWSSSVSTGTLGGMIQEQAQQKPKSFITDTPDFSILGAITQFENNLQRAGTDIGIKISDSRLGISEGASLSLLATALSLHDNRQSNLALYKGIQSNNVITVKSVDEDKGLLLGSTKVGGFQFDVTMQKKESVGSALMRLMQLAAIEITGKYYRDDFDYGQCLDSEERKKLLRDLAGITSNKDQAIPQHRAPPKKLSISIKSNANSGYFRPGEIIKTSVTPNDNGYLNCFYEMSNRKLVKIYPNKYIHESLVQDGQTIHIPGDDRIRITAEESLHSNHKERIMCLLSRTNPNQILNRIVTNVPTDKYNIEDIIRFISSALPIDSYVSSHIDINVR